MSMSILEHELAIARLFMLEDARNALKAEGCHVRLKQQRIKYA